MGRRKEFIDASPENEAKAREFMEWYAANMDKLRYCIRGGGLEYSEDLVTDAFIRAYEAIARRGTAVKDYVGYFLQTYRATFLDSKKADKTYKEISLDGDSAFQSTPNHGKSAHSIKTQLSVSSFESDAYETAVETINSEMLDYVRERYELSAVSLFEIYVGLSPDVSYKSMARILGIPATKIWPVIGQIKKDLAKRFEGRRDFLLSAVNF